MALSDTKLRSLKGSGKAVKLSDGDGLHILVAPSGSRLWRFAYRFNGKQKVLALGRYPEVSLLDARSARDCARRLLAAGRDPGEEKQAEKRRKRVAAGHTFSSVADEWFENQKVKWVDSYSDRLKSRLDADLMPKLGRRPIAEIEALEVLHVIRAIEARGAIETGRRILQMAGAIFRYGVATGRCPRDPTSDLKGALKARPPVKHRTALRADELPEFLRQLDHYDGDQLTALALRLTLMTFVRTSEVRFATWSEFEALDGAEPLWRIPAERMKMRRPHLVPLAPQTVHAIKSLKPLSGSSRYLFPAPTRSGVISENTMLFALYRMGYHGRATVHGLRSTASTILNERQFNRDWIEMQLAHSDSGVRAVYNAAEWLPGRRQMMVWWADHLEQLRTHVAAN